MQKYKKFDSFTSYLKQVKGNLFKKWEELCPLCQAKGCAKFLGYYFRKRLYWLDRLYTNILIIRFECKRFNPVPPGTHRTFSILPCPLIPYSQYPIPSALGIAEALVHNDGDVIKTVKTLEQRYTEVNPEPSTIIRIGDIVQEAIEKLNRLSQDLKENIGWRINKLMPYRDQLSSFISFVKNYQRQKARDLAYDYFDLFQKDVPYMQRDFLFGTPSQLLLT